MNAELIEYVISLRRKRNDELLKLIFRMTESAQGILVTFPSGITSWLEIKCIIAQNDK